MLPNSFQKYFLSYEEAAKDSPQFRNGILKFMDEMEDAQKWFESLSRSCKSNNEEHQKYNESVLALAKKIALKSNSVFVDAGIVKTISDSMTTYRQLTQHQEIIDKIMGKKSPVNLLGCFKEIRDVKRQLDRAMERYDANLSKYAAISKLKDPSSYTELVHSLYQSKKAYHSVCMEFIYKTFTLKAMVDPIVSLQLLPAFSELHDLYTENSQIMVGLIQASKLFHSSWATNQNEYTAEALLASYNQFREDFLAEIKLETYSGMNRESSTEKLKETSTFEKEGYLYRKVDQKWNRKYFVIKNYHLTTVKSNSSSEVISLPLLVCNTRVNNIEDRRFCFEIIAPTSVLVLQAESEKELKSWLDTIDIAKNLAASTTETTPTAEDQQLSLPPETTLSVTIEETRSLKSLDEIDEEEVTYADPNTLKKNVELHSLLKSVPLSDYVIESFTAALHSDMLIQGKIYFTQNRICFHSNILGFVNIVVIHFKDVADISKKSGTLTNSLLVTTNTGKSYVFKTYSKQERCFVVSTSIWKNTLSEQPVTTQELIDNFSAMSSKETIKPANARNSEDSKSGTSGSSGDLLTEAFVLPDSIPVPKSEIICGCKEHLEKMEVDVSIPVSAKELYENLFGTMSQSFWETMGKEKGTMNRKEGAWSKEPLPTRLVESLVPINNPMVKLKEIEVKETHVFLRKEEYLCYVIECRSSTPQVPFGDCFLSCTRYCISWVNESQCRLVISVGMQFVKSTMMKSVIKSSGIKPLSDAAIQISNQITKRFVKDSNEPVSNEFSLPLDLAVPTEEIVCGCSSHLEKIDVEVVMNTSAKHIYELLFGSLSKPFWEESDKRKGNTSRTESEWTENTKTSSFQMPMNSPMIKLKVIDVNMTTKKSVFEDYFKYVIDTTANTPQVPYGDCFQTETRYCITWMSPDSCKLVISNGVHFMKSTMMKSIIKSNGLKGAGDAANELYALLVEKTSNKPTLTREVVPSKVEPVKVHASESNRVSLVWLLVSFMAGLICMHLLTPTQTINTTGINAIQKQTKSNRMNQFISTFFKENQLTDQVHLLSDTPTVLKFKRIQTAQLELKNTRKVLDEMEKHLIWAMYFEWNQMEQSKNGSLWNVPELD